MGTQRFNLQPEDGLPFGAFCEIVIFSIIPRVRLLITEAPMNIKSSIAVFTVALVLCGAAFAHHSFAMFDRTKEVELKDATVKEWQWTSPHSWLLIWVPNGTSQPDAYSIEGTNPGILRRFGY